MGNYLYLPFIALGFYIFLLCAFIGYRDNRIIRAFLYIINANILWTLGSILMRLEFTGEFVVWYHISLLGILIMPSAFLKFLTVFLQEKKSHLMRVFGGSIYAIFIINVVTECFLAPPTIMMGDGGMKRFVYNPDFGVVVLFIPTGIILLKIIQICFKTYKEEVDTQRKITPVVLGGITLFVGNAAVMLPVFEGVPVDILSSNMNAIFLFYALYKKRLFRLSSIFSESSCYILAAFITLVIFMSVIMPLDQFLMGITSEGYQFDSMLMIVIFLSLMASIYVVIKKVINAIFVKEEVRQNEILKDFSITVAKNLEMGEILDALIDVIKETLDVRKVYIFLPNMSGTEFQVVKSGSQLDAQRLILDADNPIVNYLGKHRELLVVKDFKRTMAYRTLWETEKKGISELGLEYIAPLHNENEMVGFIALSCKNGKKESFTYDDIAFITSISSIVSIGLKNSILYQKACIEARTDELTGLMNRKYFHKTLEEQYQICENKVLSLAIINVDDFKLYNQLYGNIEGDMALKHIARIIRTTVNDRGIVARYSGKEFAIILPMWDVLAAKELVQGIREKILNINKDMSEYRMKKLTVSCGICSIPYGAMNSKQLLVNVDMAVYQVKRRGKNAVSVYSEGIIHGEGQREDKSDQTPYASYASTIYALAAAIDTKDHYTFKHSSNVAYYACELGYAYGLSEESISIIKEAALLHDIGKIGIPEDILNKPGPLTEDEYIIMKSHVENSIDIIRHLPSLDYVIPAVIGHHERYDGKGYPRQIAGDDIPLFARILCIADSFDAMISKRSYKQGMSVEKGLEIIEDELGKQFDPTLGKMFVQLMREDKIQPQIIVEPGAHESVWVQETPHYRASCDESEFK